MAFKQDRREFLLGTASAASAVAFASQQSLAADGEPAVITANFDVPDSLVHPAQWETLNPGYWQIKNGALRRRLMNVGDRARATGFPFHSMSKGSVMNTDYDPSQPPGVIYRKTKLSGAYTVKATFTYRGDRPAVANDDNPSWKMYQDGYGRLGIAFGAKSLLESHRKIRHATQAVWTDAGNLQFVRPGKQKGTDESGRGQLKLVVGDQLHVRLKVTPNQVNTLVEFEFSKNNSGNWQSLVIAMPTKATEGFVGIVGQGLIDFEVSAFEIVTQRSGNVSENLPHNDCYVCYPLGDTLQQSSAGDWTARFVGLFASDGKQVQIRIADSPQPKGGWQRVPIAGSAPIVNNDWRRNTAVIDATLPCSPADQSLYYTVWKDGVDVTTDTRIGTAATGPGTGLVGDVPTSGDYVGRLPQLQAPYKLCGLSCHAITSGLQQKTNQGYRILGGGDDWQFRDQPSQGSYQHLDDYKFQIMVWEDDVWYMELVLYPPSTDDAYKIVTQSIAGPTSRWQMMRHWNVINPGDHDYGMDDVKGPEQLIIRRVEGLGQDITYMQRNFQIVHHLITGAAAVDPLANPKKWRAWKMPHRDFTFVILDSRLWRSSQDTDIWDDSGWEKFKSLYDRTDPTRSLLGEEQFGWLQELLATDSSPLMCLTGINGLHTIWTGGKGKFESGEHEMNFSQRDRVTADYAGWVKAGADRVLELLGSRDGVVTVYGDVHNGCIMKNSQQRVIECSFGPIGRSGGRAVIPGFGPKMKDVDGREVEIHSLYHKTHADADLHGHADGDPFYWNFLEMEFDPRQVDPRIGLRVRNLVDSPREKPRGGGSLETTASHTGRLATAKLPLVTTLPHADIRFTDLDGRPIRGTRSLADGRVCVQGLVDVQPGQEVIMTAYDGQKTESQLIATT